jgi:hypothetical protein
MRAAILLCPLLLLAVASPVRAEARIEELGVTLEGAQVLARWELRDAFDQKLRERVESGLPTSIVYRIELQRDRKRWYDRQLAATSLEVVALYDAVAREFTVNFKLDGKLIESRTVRDRLELAAAMTRIGPLPVFTLEPMPGRPRLLVKVKAELGSRMILLLIPATIDTGWAESRKFRPPAAPGPS